MTRLIKKINNGIVVEYDKGKFDEWCVYLKKPNKPRYAPRDPEYFRALSDLGHIHDFQQIYNDFVVVYDLTDKIVRHEVLKLITETADRYDSDAEVIDIWFTVIYAGMVAEENKAFTKLGKRVKRLGVHQVLIDRLDPGIAANFSRGKKWRELDTIMCKKGF